jgi:hypothetical protein
MLSARSLVIAIALSALLVPSPVSAQLSLKTIYDYPVGRRPARALTIDRSTNKIMVGAENRVIVNTDLLTWAERDKKEEIETCIDKDGKVVDLPRRFPTRSNPRKAQCLFFQGGPESLKSTEFLGSSSAVTATTEVLTDVYYGIRLGFSTAVTAPAETGEGDGTGTGDTAAAENAAEQNLNLLAANGGNLALTANYPIYFRGFEHPVDKDRKTGYLLSNFFGRIGGTVGKFEPAGGSGAATTYSWGDVNGAAEVGAETRAAFSSESDTFGLIAYMKGSLIAGTEDFSNAIGSKDRNAIVHLRAAVGARLGGLFTIGLGWTWYSDNDIPAGGASVTFGFSK